MSDDKIIPIEKYLEKKEACVDHCIHPDLLPPRNPLVIFAPPETEVEDRYWLLGFVGANGENVPLGRIVWHGDIVNESCRLDDEGNFIVQLEELDEPPKCITDYLARYAKIV